MTVWRSENHDGYRRALPVLLAAGACGVVGLASLSEPSHRVGLLLLLAWQTVATAILHLNRRAAANRPPVRAIPLHFEGDLGRYSLRSQADGRTVQIRDGATVVAELVATDDGDRLVVDPEAAGGSEVESLGAALGRAIEMVVAADAYRAVVRGIARASRRTHASVQNRARLLRRIGRVAADN
jgi:hypothetical protein